MPSVVVRDAAPGLDDDAVAGLMAEYLTWAIERLATEHGVHEPPADPAGIREHLDHYRPPRGRLLLAEGDGEPVGVGALRMLGADAAEVKRMYVVPRWRGRRVGSAILDHLLDEAATRGAVVMRLDSCLFMTDAQRLYRSRGFTERSPYEGTEIPAHLHQHWVFFERAMSSF